MLRIAILASLVLAAACSKKDITADVEALAERACACTDAACADKVVDDLLALAEANKNPGGDQKRTSAAGQKLGGCAVKAGVDPKALVAKLKKLQDM